jgi:hypothetical protein
VSLQGITHASQIRLDVSANGYSRFVSLAPGRSMVVEPPGRRVVIERVLVPEGCTASGLEWHCEWNGEPVAPSAHVRLRIESRTDAAVSPVTSPTSGCGDPGLGPVAAPPGVRRSTHDFTIRIPERGRVRRGGIELTPLEPERDLEGASQGPRRAQGPRGPQGVLIALEGDTTSRRLIRPDMMTDGTRVRIDRRVFVREGSRDRPTLSVWTGVCSREARATLSDGPHHLWLGTDGYEHVTLDLGGGEAITATLSVEAHRAAVTLGAPTSTATVELRPDSVGRSFDLDGVHIQVVSIVATNRTTWTGDRYESADAIPHVLVGIQVAR